MIDILEKVLNPDIYLTICESDSRFSGKRSLTLKENDPKSQIQELFVIDIPENCIAFTLDYKPKGNKLKQYKNCFHQL